MQQGVNGGESVKHELFIRKASAEGGYELCLKLMEHGHFVGTVKYGGKVVGQPCFTIICLASKKLRNHETMQVMYSSVPTGSEVQSIRTTLLSRKQVCYEALMLTTGGKLTKVQCFITPQVCKKIFVGRNGA